MNNTISKRSLDESDQNIWLESVYIKVSHRQAV